MQIPPYQTDQTEQIAPDLLSDVLVQHIPTPSPAMHRRVRILLVFEQFVYGGAELLHLRLAQGLPKDRYDVRIGVLLPGGGISTQVESSRIPIVPLYRRYPADLSPILRLRRYCIRENIDITLGILWLSSAFAGIAGIGLKTKVIGSTRQDNYDVQNFGQVRALFDRLLVPSLVTRVVNSPRLQDYLVRHRYPAHHVTVIPNGIAIPDMRHYEQRRKELRSQYGIPQDAHCAGMLAVLRPEKDHMTFLRVIARLISIFPEARFVIAGEGSERPHIEQIVDQLAIRSHVVFTGMVPNAAAIIPALDVVVLTSLHEGVPNAVLEGMSWARPVVATRVAGVPDVVSDGVTGFLAEAGDDHTIARAIDQLFSCPDLAVSMGQRGRTTMQAFWSNQRMVNDYDALFLRCLA